MGLVDIQLTCPCGCVGYYVLNVIQQPLEQWRANAQMGMEQYCVACGCKYKITDQVTTLGMQDISAPRIDTLSVTSGPIAGGTTVDITGHCFDEGQLVVRFDDLPATIVSVSEDAAQVVTPPGRIRLVENGIRQRKMTVSNVTGSFVAGEALLGQSSRMKGVYRSTGSGFLYIDLAFGHMTPLGFAMWQPGETVLGAQSGATATFAGLVSDFSPGETVTGESSGAAGVLADSPSPTPMMPLKVPSVAGVFQADEWVVGSVSGARTKLGPTPTSTTVFVTVENENGTRDLGSRYYPWHYTT